MSGKNCIIPMETLKSIVILKHSTQNLEDLGPTRVTQYSVDVNQQYIKNTTEIPWNVFVSVHYEDMVVCISYNNHLPVNG